MNETEILQSSTLGSWLDTLQGSIPGTITIIIDSCNAGSFLPQLTPPPGAERIVIASCLADEIACFHGQGTISFSYFFWSAIFNRNSVYDAFCSAKNGMALGNYQTALLDDNGNGVGNEKADGTLSRLTYIDNGGPIPGGTGATNKAIIVAGGGPYPGNYMWDDTQLVSNHAYRTLLSKGFSHESIYYLTADTTDTYFDVDGNGALNEVDGDATNANLEYAIEAWAADADNLTLYLADHGNVGSFGMNAEENLQASDLDSWLDYLQGRIPSPGTITVIIDACNSGSFLPYLTPPLREGSASLLQAPPLMKQLGTQTKALYPFPTSSGVPFLTGTTSMMPFVQEKMLCNSVIIKMPF